MSSQPIRASSKFISAAEGVRAILSIEKLDLHYGAAQALRQVSVEARVGEITTVLGRNGVGKTSLLRAIVGHQATSGGRIAWQGEDLGRLPPFERARRGIAIVPQGREIFPLLTVEENLQTGFACLKRRDQSIDEEIYDLFPVLKSMLHRRGGDLSGGQQQQLAIARALVTKPKLLVLDEPTEGIQPSIIKDIGRAIHFLRSKGDMAILLVEQYFEFARDLADRYAVMDRGQVVLSGTRAEMVEADVRRRLSV
jgi:urea transport system ATP-binding protein